MLYRNGNALREENVILNISLKQNIYRYGIDIILDRLSSFLQAMNNVKIPISMQKSWFLQNFDKT